MALPDCESKGINPVTSDDGSNDCYMDPDERLLEKYVHKANILDSVASSNAFFKSQQRGEKDLTFDEKREIAENLLDKNSVLFLQRYWKFINVRDVSYFEELCGDYEVNFYVQEIRKLSDEKKSKARFMNRRYEALKKMVKEGSYFSDEEMRRRNPYLYDQLVGRYMPEDRMIAASRKKHKNMSFAGFLMECIDKGCESYLMREQQAAEQAVVEEEDDDEEDDDDDDDEIDMNSFNTGRRSSSLPEAERQMLMTEFTNIMYESFLSGQDKNFDYSTVDDNEEFDSVQEREIDEEEKYFDAD